MIVRDKRTTMYTTRQHYGTSIVIHLHHSDDNTLTGVSFSGGKIRDTIELPESKEDKKVWMVIDTIKELIESNKLEYLTATVYEKDLLINKKDSDEVIFGKIKAALFDFCGIVISCNAISHDVEKSIEKALRNGEIDVF